LVVSGCKHGPQIEACVLNGNTELPGASCSYKKNSYEKPVDSLEGYICFSSSDMERFLKGCHDRAPALVTTCLVDSENTQLVCADDSTDFILSWQDAINYICTNNNHLERLLKYCFR